MDGEELEVDGASVAVGMMDAGDERADFCMDAQLFVEFARESLLRGFSGLDLAAGELPFEGHGLLRAALADENGVSAENERGGDVTDSLSLFLLNVYSHALTV